jgi:hypothetical protein
MYTRRFQSFGFLIRDRDLLILRELFESRVMKNAHITALFFDGKPEATKKRLQILKRAGLISERPRLPFSPSILSLSSSGLSLLKEQGVLACYPPFDHATLRRRLQVSELTLRHELSVMNVKVAVIGKFADTPKASVLEFTTWPALNQFTVPAPAKRGASVTVKPDGFIRIKEDNAHGKSRINSFFLEVDRSSESQEVLVDKAMAYVTHFKTGGFAQTQGAHRSAFREFPFRVLMIFLNVERRDNFAARLLRLSPPILTQVCLSTLDEVIRDPVGPIWITPSDFRDATKGTRNDQDRDSAPATNSIEIRSSSDASSSVVSLAPNNPPN